MKNPIVVDLGYHTCGSKNSEFSDTVTLRDIVALAALHGIVNNPNFNSTAFNPAPLVDASFAIADEFLEQREE